jgi:hypothetical protein
VGAVIGGLRMANLMAKGLVLVKDRSSKKFENSSGQGPDQWSKTRFFRETLKRWGWPKAGSDKV